MVSISASRNTSASSNPSASTGAFSYLLYPLLLAGALILWSTLWLRFGWDADVTMQIVYWAFIAVLLILERVRPSSRLGTATMASSRTTSRCPS